MEVPQDAFYQLKRALGVPVLARQTFTQPIVIQTNDSQFAIEAVLTQEAEDGEYPIVFVSRVFIAAEKHFIREEGMPRCTLVH